MDEMKAVDLGHVMSSIKASGRPNTVLWQAPDSIAFVARGREFRSEFHSDPSDEVMYMIKGDMNLHCTWGAGPTLTRGGERRVPRMFRLCRLCPLPNTVITPHLGYVTEEGYRIFYGHALEDVKAWLAGQPVRVLRP